MMNNDMIHAKYPEIFRNGGRIKGRMRTSFREGFTLLKLYIKRGTYHIKPIIHEMGFTILIQFIIAKKHKIIEYFEYFTKHIKAPIDPSIPLKIKLSDNNGLANPKTKK